MAQVVAVHADAEHRFSKQTVSSISLLAGLGVAGDAHQGQTVQHRSRLARNPDAPNLRQVHLLHIELIEELQANGFAVGPGVMGENITTSGLSLLQLNPGAVLRIGVAQLEITGLRNPCKQLDNYQQGLMQAVLSLDDEGHLIRRAGVMATVSVSGDVRGNDTIEILDDGKPGPLLPV